MPPILTAEDVVKRITAERAFVDERGAVGIRLEPAAAIVRQYGDQFRVRRRKPVRRQPKPRPLLRSRVAISGFPIICFASCEGRISRHLVPLIGSAIARNLTTADVQRMADAIAAGKTTGTFKGKPRGKAVVTGGAGTATRVVELLGGIWTWGRKRGFVAGASPTADVDRLRGDAKDRMLSDDELKSLGGNLDDSPASAALRLIALTGWRREEIVGLRWSEIDGQTAHLEHTKSGRSKRPIGKAALDVLATVTRITEWVFPNRTLTGSADLKASIAALFDVAGLPDARSHALRRTFASTAADMGYSDATIAELLGHARRGVTERHYVRRSDPVLITAADAVSGRISAVLAGEQAASCLFHPALFQRAPGRLGPKLGPSQCVPGSLPRRAQRTSAACSRLR